MPTTKPKPLVGQVWRIDRDSSQLDFPIDILIVADYPFARPGDGRHLVVELIGTVGALMRMTEDTILKLYRFHSTLSEESNNA